MEIVKQGGLGQALECKLLQSIFDRITVIELSTRCCKEFVTSTGTEQMVQSYDDWLTSFAEAMYAPDAATFLSQMELGRLTRLLSERDHEIVFCRKVEGDCTWEYQLHISYTDESREQLVVLRGELSQDRPRPLETLNELAHSNARFQFLVERLLEDFIEIRVLTGECRVFSASKEEGFGTFKEQIAWWAEHLILPEEREDYIREYELEHLMQCLHANNGHHSATYTTCSSHTKNNILISSTLVGEAYGREEEYIFAYAQDITPMKQQEIRNKQLVDISQQLLTLSQTEPVTGLLNRAACEALVEEHLAAGTDSPGTMLLIDIDCFKDFNDQYGHRTGDFVLKTLGKMMQDIFRSDDIIARWGGDEFVVFMRGVSDKRTISSRIERLRVRLRQCKKDGSAFPITISVGGKIATRGMTREGLFEHCDKALYRVKKRGRDNYFIDAD